ncbi:CRISPR system precrRNA processing endoribonuclease RAMP protein Cas6 [bacterium]|nr:CRISPR system precrRNA processing endoribonuclease RAMP protein Cas6 [bacterium]
MEIFKFKFVLSWQQETKLPKFKASKFRGCLGHILKKLGGENPQSPYFLLFETPNQSNGNNPHPFWLEFPDSTTEVFGKNSKFEFHLLLLGNYKNYLPYFVYTFFEIGKRGMIDNYFYELKEIWQENLKEKIKIYSDKQELISNDLSIPFGTVTKNLTGKLLLTFTSPVCIRKDGITLEKIDFLTFYKTLARRILILRKFNETSDLLFDNKQLTELSENIRTVKQKFDRFSVNRWSNRQQQKIPLDGFTGFAIFEGDFAPFQEVLEFGQFVHIGKNTVFGFGKFEVDFL